MAFCWAVDPSAVSAVLPAQFTGPFGTLRPCRLLSLPQPVDVMPTITAVDAAAASALRTASSFTDLAFPTDFFPRPNHPAGVSGFGENYASGVDDARRRRKRGVNTSDGAAAPPRCGIDAVLPEPQAPIRPQRRSVVRFDVEHHRGFVGAGQAPRQMRDTHRR